MPAVFKIETEKRRPNPCLLFQTIEDLDLEDPFRYSYAYVWAFFHGNMLAKTLTSDWTPYPMTSAKDCLTPLRPHLPMFEVAADRLVQLFGQRQVLEVCWRQCYVVLFPFKVVILTRKNEFPGTHDFLLNTLFEFSKPRRNERGFAFLETMYTTQTSACRV